MSNNKVCMKMKNIFKNFFILFFLCFLVSCSNNKRDTVAKTEKIEQQKKEIKKIGKYIYIDANNVAHRTNSCRIIKDTWGIEVEAGFNSSLRRVLTDTLNREVLESACSYCIGDSIYEVLLDSIKCRNLYE